MSSNAARYAPRLTSIAAGSVSTVRGWSVIHLGQRPFSSTMPMRPELPKSNGGRAAGYAGTVIMLTFGTGHRYGTVRRRQLLPNSEFGHIEMRGVDAEKWTSARVRTEQKLDLPAWIGRVNEYLAHIHALFWPDLFILGWRGQRALRRVRAAVAVARRRSAPRISRDRPGSSARRSPRRTS